MQIENIKIGHDLDRLQERRGVVVITQYWIKVRIRLAQLSDHQARQQNLMLAIDAVATKVLGKKLPERVIVRDRVIKT